MKRAQTKVKPVVKKSKTGIATPKHELDLIRRRLADADRHHQERQN